MACSPLTSPSFSLLASEFLGLESKGTCLCGLLTVQGVTVHHDACVRFWLCRGLRSFQGHDAVLQAGTVCHDGGRGGVVDSRKTIMRAEQGRWRGFLTRLGATAKEGMLKKVSQVRALRVHNEEEEGGDARPDLDGQGLCISPISRRVKPLAA
eukprot:1159093-Pelagomonas_calceolata.AAC.4